MNDTQAHILVVDDDTDLRVLTAVHLNRAGFHVDTAKDAKTALEMLKTTPFDLIVLDVMMPKTTGLELTKQLREDESITYDIPIIMLTAMGSNDSRVSGLESGADDYLTKPFDPRELVLRIQKLLKRAAPTPKRIEPTIPFGPFIFTPHTKQLQKDSIEIHLTSAEAELLHILTQSLNTPISREDISSQLNHISERSIDVQITRLRKKMEDNPKQPEFLQAVWGKGYILRDITR